MTLMGPMLNDCFPFQPGHTVVISSRSFYILIIQKSYFMFIFTCLFSPLQCNFVYSVQFNMPNSTKYENTNSNIIIHTKHI